jgi:hypothetical protein
VVDYIDACGARVAVYDTGLGAADRPHPAQRFAAMVLRSHTCADLFGLIRREAIRSPLLAFHGADRAFLGQMALRGRLIQLPEPLVQMREHRRRYTRRETAATGRLAWHDASLVGRFSFPTWRLYGEYVHMVHSEALSLRERAACYRVLAQWWFRNWNPARAAVDLLAACVPGVVGFAETVKTRLIGAAPGHYVDHEPSEPSTYPMPVRRVARR